MVGVWSADPSPLGRRGPKTTVIQFTCQTFVSIARFVAVRNGAVPRASGRAPCAGDGFLLTSLSGFLTTKKNGPGGIPGPD